MDDERRKLYQMQAEVMKALGHPIRLAVVDLLADGELCVCDIAEALGAGRSNVSRHLAVMVGAGILSCRKDGLRMLYRLRAECVLNFFSCVRNVLRERVEADSAALEKL